MKVLLLQNVLHIWKAWEIKEVKPGFAANMLFPKKLAVELTPEKEKELKQKQKKQEEHRRKLVENRHEIVEKLNNQKLEFKLKTDWKNKVFGGIWEKDIIRTIKNKFNIELAKKHIDMPGWHIKKLGETNIFIKLWKDAMAKIFINVIAE